MNNKRFSPRNMAMIGMLSAISFILMFLEFSIPIMPSFIKLDLSELPALIGAFAMGPAEGVLICLFKNLMDESLPVANFANIDRRRGRTQQLYSGCGLCICGRSYL